MAPSMGPTSRGDPDNRSGVATRQRMVRGQDGTGLASSDDGGNRSTVSQARTDRPVLGFARLRIGLRDFTEAVPRSIALDPPAGAPVPNSLRPRLIRLTLRDMNKSAVFSVVF